MHGTKQVSEFRRGTYDILGTSKSDKVAKFIITSLLKNFNTKKIAHFLNLQRMKHKDKKLKAYISPRERLDIGLGLLDGLYDSQKRHLFLQEHKIHQKKLRT